ncbi:MAG TPA: DUF6265 family protein [Allosphingosinicella sp.]|jgi:hypothetical protein
MRIPGLAAASMLFLAGFAPAPGNRPSWLAGHWMHEDKEKAVWTEESWLSRGRMLVGVAMSGSGEAVKSFEYMRIETDKDGSTTFWASPQGRTPVPFRMVSLGAAEVVFQNPANDYPTRIVYRRSGGLLVATISGPGGAYAQTWRYRRVRD